MQTNLDCIQQALSKADDAFKTFVTENPSTRFIRFQWVDYSGVRRLRIVPVSHAKKLLAGNKGLGITVAIFSLTPQDHFTADLNVVGQWSLTPDWHSLYTCEGHTPGHATLSCFFRELEEVGGGEVAVCPRTALQKAAQRAQDYDLGILVGFETEFTLLDLETFEVQDSAHAYAAAHSYTPKTMSYLDEVTGCLQRAGIEVQYMHTETSAGQFELITGPLPPMEAVDALYVTRETIQTVAQKYGYRATMHPKLYKDQAGTASHTHMSTAKPGTDVPFFAGVLEHLNAVMALTVPTTLSYDRVGNRVWAGGLYRTWGNRNKEVPLQRASAKDQHWEVRCVDGTANMYLGLAAIISAGVLGVEQGTELPPPCDSTFSSIEFEHNDIRPES